MCPTRNPLKRARSFYKTTDDGSNPQGSLCFHIEFCYNSSRPLRSLLVAFNILFLVTKTILFLMLRPSRPSLVTSSPVTDGEDVTVALLPFWLSYYRVQDVKQANVNGFLWRLHIWHWSDDQEIKQK